jgi:hypothetical protein
MVAGNPAASLFSRTSGVLPITQVISGEIDIQANLTKQFPNSQTSAHIYSICAAKLPERPFFDRLRRFTYIITIGVNTGVNANVFSDEDIFAILFFDLEMDYWPLNQPDFFHQFLSVFYLF